MSSLYLRVFKLLQLSPRPQSLGARYHSALVAGSNAPSTKPLVLQRRDESQGAPGGTKDFVAEFFARYPAFRYDPSASVMDEWRRMCIQPGWTDERTQSKKRKGDKKMDEKEKRNERKRKGECERRDRSKRMAYKLLKDAFVLQFNSTYGTDVRDLGAWQRFCKAIGIVPVPEKMEECRKAVDRTHVNLVDLIDVKESDGKVQLFATEKKLSEYTLATGKIFPRKTAYAGSFLRCLLRHIVDPGACEKRG
ncbi:hypothetical protein AcW2_000377 [Taiwanofungus camphoratus]|nr:hypothetical protein AcW2_000377 [Antrodia cinnamomea]